MLLGKPSLRREQVLSFTNLQLDPLALRLKQHAEIALNHEIKNEVQALPFLTCVHQLFQSYFVPCISALTYRAPPLRISDKPSTDIQQWNIILSLATNRIDVRSYCWNQIFGLDEFCKPNASHMNGDLPIWLSLMQTKTSK